MRTTSFVFAYLIFAFFIVLGIGCQSTPDGPGDHSNGTSLSGFGNQRLTFGDFDVVFTGRSYNGTSTTFSYEVDGPTDDMHFRIGWPTTECTAAPTSWLPSNGATGNNDCCINPGLEWHPSTGDRPFVASYTFAGDIPEGIVPASIKSGPDVFLGDIPGPGVPVFSISGTVFQDADANALLDANETIISGVTVNLIDDGTVISSAVSGADGFYEFEAACGTYTVMIDTATLTGTEKTYFISTTPVSYELTVGPDSPGNNFGFDVNTDKLVDDLDNKTLPTTGLTAAFWKKEFQFAVAGRTSVYSPAQLLAFLDAIEDLALEDPFIFPSGDQERLNFVYQLLRKPIRTPFEAFERELITLELNYAAGKGIDLSTELVLIGWGESLYNDSAPSNPKGVIIEAGTILDATAVYQGINSNKSTGGGGTQ